MTDTTEAVKLAREALERLRRANFGSELIGLAQQDIPILAQAVLYLSAEVERLTAALAVCQDGAAHYKTVADGMRAELDDFRNKYSSK